jgi:hypothetical protein
MKIILTNDGYQFAGTQTAPTKSVEAATAELLALGVTIEQISEVTGFGHRHGYDCKPEDTRLNKYRAGALSARGVMGDIFGTDTPQHHRGHNL